jgi:diadenosine tetraphosphate (Ap4A) HIT family hydrolase
MSDPADAPEKPRERRCPFCNPEEKWVVLRNELAYARRDIRPVSQGHMLIIPFRHVPRFFDTTPEERAAIMDLTFLLRDYLEEHYHPAGYNFGVNIGEAAGQAIMHVHFHLIPRYRGDARGGRSGLRHVIPEPCVWQRKLGDFYPEQARRRRPAKNE